MASCYFSDSELSSQIVAQYMLSAPTESACSRIQTIKSSIDDQHDCTVGEKNRTKQRNK